MSLAQKLAQQAVEKRKAAKALAAKEVLSAEETKQVDQLLADADTLDTQAKDAKARQDRLDANDRALEEANRPAPRRLGADDTDERSDTRAAPAFMKDPKRGYANMRAFLQDLRRARATGRASEQLRSLRPSAAFLDGVEIGATAGSDEHSTFYDPSLGAMVPVGLLPGILETPAPDDPFPGTRRAPINVPVVEITARVDKDHSTSVSGGFRMYRRAESQAGTASRGKVEKIQLRADALMGVSFETEELLRDAPGLVYDMIQRGFQEEAKAIRAQEIISGDGVGRNLGWRNSGCAITVTKETGQKPSTIVFENLVNMLARGYGEGRFIANKTCMPQLAKMNGGTNGLVWQPSAREGMPGVLFGRQLVFTEFLPIVGAAGCIALCNDAEYQEVVRQELEAEESIHVRFLENERAFRFTARRGGAPLWRSALTPKNGDTLSPWVELGAVA